MIDNDSGDYANHLVILHISDLHARPDDDYKDHLDKVRSNIPDGSLDAIVITGDLTDHGKDMNHTANALVVAIRFINSLTPLLKPDCKENVFTVPGNHDAVWFGQDEGRDASCRSVSFTINLDSKEVCLTELPSKVSGDDHGGLLTRIREGALRTEDVEINRKRFILHESVTSMLSRHKVVVDGIHRLVKATGMNVVLLNTEFLYAPNSTHEPDFYPGNIDEIIEELKKQEYWGVPTIAIGHRPDMNIYSSARFKQYLRDCRVVMYMSGHKHDTSVSMDDGVLDFTTWRFELSSDKSDSGIDTGYSVIEWFGDRANATFFSLLTGRRRTEPTVASTVYRNRPAKKYWEFYKCDICQLKDKIENSQGAIIDLVGSKGAGKTTVLRDTDVDLASKCDSIYIDVRGLNADQVVSAMIREMPNRRTSDNGTDDLVDLLTSYSRRVVFLLDNVGEYRNVGVDTCSEYSEVPNVKSDGEEGGDEQEVNSEDDVPSDNSEAEDGGCAEAASECHVGESDIGCGLFSEGCRFMSDIESIMSELRQINARCPNTTIVVSGLELIEGTIVVNITKNDPTKLIGFFADIFREKSGRPLETAERNAVKRWLVEGLQEVENDVVIAVASICAIDPGIIGRLEAGGVRPESLIFRPGILDNSELELLFLLANAGPVRMSTLKSIGAEKQLDKLIFYNICQESNDWVRLNWTIDGKRFAGCPSGLSVRYLRKVIREDLSSEYGSVLTLLTSLLRAEGRRYHSVLVEVAAEIREFVKKARQNARGMLGLLNLLWDYSSTYDGGLDVASNKDTCKRGSRKSTISDPGDDESGWIVSREVILIEQANLLYRMGELESAKKKYEGLGNRYRAKLGLAATLMRMGEVEDSLKPLNEVRKATDVDSRMLYARSIKLLGDSSFLRGEYVQAAEMYRKAINMSVLGNDKYLVETYAYACRGIIDMMVTLSEVDNDDLARFILTIRDSKPVGFASSVHIAVQCPRKSLYSIPGGGNLLNIDEKHNGEVPFDKDLFDADQKLLQGNFNEAMAYFEKISSGSVKSRRIRNFAEHGVADCLLNMNRLAEAKERYRSVCSYYSLNGSSSALVQPKSDPDVYEEKDFNIWIMAELGFADALRRNGEYDAAVAHYMRACKMMKRILRADGN